MAVYLIAYDLVRASHDDYKNVHEKIKEMSNDWARIQLSTFLINTTLRAKEIKNYLAPEFNKNEKLIVALLGNEISGLHEFSDEVSKWLAKNGYPVIL
ncbi:hypothetical protein PAECIP111893_02431 [Paenibacillus plantiphilus]|uniref:Uncharacterized protein n=1 Tax=Paenibacillus plantiphilus TaxID=2905650 RepID=A0ABN8GFD1_9BACL|nr:hypothetical protein [Paenibacillus plantiphilus]CAH1205826.1 hypothetical protein PAECIP111893_02431 [Paenibacillus plantiphilus]